ncbi:MAG: 2Fe-2S iron-sulfur cluster-binding protein [Gammaproteobacteria bacterium]
MTANISIQPSGHAFLVEKDETILEGALRSGLNLNYHCSNGTCGECKARIVSGAAGQILHHDYVLSAQDKTQNKILLCRAHAASDMVLEASEAGSVDDIPVQQLTTQVHKAEFPVEDVAMITLRTPRSQTLRFFAGQHITLRLNGLKPRNKSISSCPCNGMYLQFHQRRVEGDEFSDYIFSRLKQREKIAVEGPYGGFVLDEASKRPAIFIAYDTGFSPIKSVIEHAISLDVPQAIRLYWITRKLSAHYLANYCRSWESALDDFSYLPLTSNLDQLVDSDVESDELDPDERAMVQTAKRVIQDYPDLSGHDVYVNGPQTVLQVMRKLLLDHGLPVDRLFIDTLKRY